MWFGTLRLLFPALWLLVSGCASSGANVPEALAQQLDRNVAFADLVASPDTYKGRLVLLGGAVLKAKRLKEGTQVELLQLPLNEDQEPATELTQSQGRMLALHREPLDPATLAAGTMVTFVGEVSGATIDKLDEVDYRFPTLIVKHWHSWPPAAYDRRGDGPRFGLYGGMGVGGSTRGGGGLGIGF